MFNESGEKKRGTLLGGRLDRITGLLRATIDVDQNADTAPVFP
jgi:hypothetical protein